MTNTVKQVFNIKVVGFFAWMDYHCTDSYMHYLINPYNNSFYTGGRGNAEGMHNMFQATQLVNDGGGSRTQACLPRAQTSCHHRGPLVLDTMSHSSALKITTHCYGKPLNHRNIC